MSVTYVSSGKVVKSKTVASGDEQYILEGGKASNTIVNGVQYVSSGGSAVRTTVKSGGSQYVAGIATRTTVSGGSMNLISGGVASNTNVKSSGWMQVSSGTATSTTLNSGGSMTIGYIDFIYDKDLWKNKLNRVPKRSAPLVIKNERSNGESLDIFMT